MLSDENIWIISPYDKPIKLVWEGPPIYERDAVDILLQCLADNMLSVQPFQPHDLQIPTRAVFNGPATILFWPDGTKTVVKCQEGDEYDREKGVAMAMLKKYFGGKGRYNDVLRSLIRPEQGDDSLLNTHEKN